jgi:centromeric protein E
MKALGDPKTQHVNYRDSNLTRILQPSLSGNARMAIVFCVSPSELYLEETRSTLKFATRAKKVKTRPKVNKIMDDKSKIKALERELEAAKLELVNAGVANVKDLERQVAVSSKEAVASKEKVGRLTSIILNLNHGIFQTNNGDQKPSTVLISSKRRLSAGGTPSRTTTNDGPENATGPATVPRPDKRRKDASSHPLPHALQLNLFQEALASKSDALEAEREKVMRMEESLRAATERAEGAEKELSASQAEASHLSTQLTSLRPVLEKAFFDQQADQSKLQELQAKYDAEAKERQMLQQALDGERKRAEELELRNAELSTSLERKTGRFESDMAQLTGQLESLGQTHEAAQREVETLQVDLAKSREENQVLRDTNSSLEEAKALCERQMNEVTSNKTTLEEQIKSLQELRDQETHAFEEEKARLEVEITTLSDSKQSFEERCTSLQMEVSTLSDDSKSLKCKVEALETEKSLLEATIRQKDVALDEQATELEATNLRLEETVQITSTSIADLKTKVAEKEEEVSNVRATLSQAHAELDSLKQTLIVSEEQCASFSAERDSIRGELEASSKQLVRASEINEENRVLIETLRSSLAELESKESSVASCLQTTTQERDDAISNLALARSEVEQIAKEKGEARVECESLRQRLVSAEEQHAQLTSDYMSVQECLSSNQASLESTTQAMLSHQNSCETLRAQVLALTKENDRVNGELSECLATLEQLKADESCRLRTEQEEKERVRALHAEEVEVLQVRLSEASDELERSRDALASLRSEFNDLVQRNDAMQASIHEGTEKEATLSRKFDELQQSYDSTKEEVDRLQSEAAQTVGLLDKAEQERSALLADMQSLNSTVDELTKTKSDLLERISTLDRELEQALSAAQNDRQALLDQTQHLETAVESRSALQGDLTKMAEAKEAASAQLSVAQEELDRVTSSWESTKKLLVEAERQINRLELLESAGSDRIASFEDLTQRLQTEIDDQATRNQSLADSLTESQSLVSEITEKMGELEREKSDSLNLVTQLQEQIQQTTTEIEQLTSALNESRVECDGLKHELVRSHDMLETASGQLKEKQESINELEDQIASMRNMLNERHSPVDKNESILQSHGEGDNAFRALVAEGNDPGNEYELKLLLARANETITSARQREIQYVRDLEALQAQYESAKAQLEQAESTSCTSGDIEKLLVENQELEERLQKELADRSAAEAEMEHRFLEAKRGLIQEAESTMRNLQTDLRKTKEAAKELEAEAYAGRQENQDLRERLSSALARVTELEIGNERLLVAVDEAIRNQTSESMRLSLEAKAAKEAEYATKQMVRVLEQKLRDSLDANAKLSMEAKECKMLRVTIKTLQTELEAVTNSGSGRDEAIAKLRDELRVKDERIIKLEKLKFTKEQAAQLRKLKVRTQWYIRHFEGIV